MERIKHILILLSLMLCFGNVSGQFVETDEDAREIMEHIESDPTNLACKIDKGEIENHPGYPDEIYAIFLELDYYLFKIKSPLKSFTGAVQFYLYQNDQYGYFQLDGEDFSFNSDYLLFVGNATELFRLIDRKTLELKVNLSPDYQSSTIISVCEIVSESKMKQLEKEMIDKVNKGNQI